MDKKEDRASSCLQRNSRKVCAVSKCKGTPGMVYHNFPKNQALHDTWKSLCQKKSSFKATHSQVCSIHFSEDSYKRDLEHELLNLPPRKRLNPEAVPSLFLPNSKSVDSETAEETEESRKKELDLRNQEMVLNLLQYGPEPRTKDAGIQTRPSFLLDKTESLKAELRKTRAELRNHKVKINFLNKKLKRLEAKEQKYCEVEKVLNQTCAPAQVKKVLRPDQKFVHYSKQDIVTAMVIRSMSKSTFDYLRSKKIMHLPSVRTQGRWLEQFQKNAGFQVTSPPRNDQELVKTNFEELLINDFGQVETFFSTPEEESDLKTN